MNWRIIASFVILSMGLLDLGLTYYYVRTYKNWQPTKPFKMIELNPLLVFLWNNMGLILGMIVGSVIILSLQYLVVKSAYGVIVLILFGFLCFAIYNHFNNITLLTKLIEMYPTGKLPVETFGEVIGNNK